MCECSIWEDFPTPNIICNNFLQNYPQQYTYAYQNETLKIIKLVFVLLDNKWTGLLKGTLFHAIQTRNNFTFQKISKEEALLKSSEE